MKNKKAQISSTLTWFVAFLVIFFVMLLFLSSTIFLSRVKGIKVSEPIKYNAGALESQRALIIFLDTVEVSREDKIKDLILLSVDPYFEIKDMHKGEQNLIDWAYKVYGDIQPLEKIVFEDAFSLFEGDDIREIIGNDIRFGEELGKKLDSICCECYLQIPQGLVHGGSSVKTKGFRQRKIPRGLGAVLDNPFDVYEDSYKNWQPPVLIEIPYRGEIFKIKYRELEKC